MATEELQPQIDENGISTTDVLKLASIAGDLTGVVAGFIPGGSAVAFGSGVASTAAMFGADVAEDGFQLSDLGGAALGLSLDALSALPYMGQLAKVEKVGKLLTKLAPWVLKTFGAVMGTAGVASAIPTLQKAAAGEHLSIDDYRNLTNAIQGLAGFYHMGKGHLDNKKVTAERESKLGKKLAADSRYTLDPENHIGLQYEDEAIELTPTVKQWKNGQGKNYAMEVRLKAKPDQVFEIVQDTGIDGAVNGEYSLHFKSDKGSLTPEEVDHLSTAIYNMLPDGAVVLTHGEVTPGAGSMFSSRLRTAGFQPAGGQFEVTQKGEWTPEQLQKYGVIKTPEGKLRMQKLIKSGDQLVCQQGCKAPQSVITKTLAQPQRSPEEIIQLAQDSNWLRSLKPGDLTPEEFSYIPTRKLAFVDPSVRFDLSGYNLIYTGTRHSIGEIVDVEGNVNEARLVEILKEIKEHTPAAQRELQEWHSSNKRHIAHNTEDSLKHVLAVARSAKAFPTPSRTTKQYQVFTAVMHDIGHMVDPHADRHGAIGEILIKQAFPNTPKQVLNAVRMHMSHKQFTSPLQKALHAADVDDGMSASFDQFLEAYPKNQEQYRYLSPEYIPLQADMFTGRKLLSGRKSAEKLGVVRRLRIAGVELPIYPVKSKVVGVHVDEQGRPLWKLDGQVMTAEDAGKLIREQLEQDGRLKTVQGLDKVLPIYGDEIITDKRVKSEFLGKTKRTRLIQEAIEQSKSNGEYEILRKSALEDKDPNAIHVLANVKYAQTHELSGINIAGGRTSQSTYIRLSLGQISDIVDAHKSGYKGTISPVIKGNGNFLGRASQGIQPKEEFGGYAYTSNSELVAARYADIRYFRRGENRKKLLEGLSPQKKEAANKIMDQILYLLKSMGEKQGKSELTVTRKGFRQGTYENFLPKFYSPKNAKNREKLIRLYDQLQHVLGNGNLGVGGTRRGIVLLNDNIVTSDYKHKRYSARLPKDHPLRKILEQYADHNGLAQLMSQLRIRQAVTANIGETTSQALKAGAPYGADFMTRPQDFIISRWKEGGEVNYINLFKHE